MDDSILVGRKRATAYLDISLRTLDYVISAKELRAFRVGRRVLIPRAELEKFARRDHSTQSDGPGPAQ